MRRLTDLPVAAAAVVEDDEAVVGTQPQFVADAAEAVDALATDVANAWMGVGDVTVVAVEPLGGAHPQNALLVLRDGEHLGRTLRHGVDKLPCGSGLRSGVAGGWRQEKGQQ